MSALRSLPSKAGLSPAVLVTRPLRPCAMAPFSMEHVDYGAASQWVAAFNAQGFANMLWTRTTVRRILPEIFD